MLNQDGISNLSACPTLFQAWWSAPQPANLWDITPLAPGSVGANAHAWPWDLPRLLIHLLALWVLCSLASSPLPAGEWNRVKWKPRPLLHAQEFPSFIWWWGREDHPFVVKKWPFVQPVQKKAFSPSAAAHSWDKSRGWTCVTSGTAARPGFSNFLPR